MNGPEFEVVYDAASIWFPRWPLPLLGILAALVGAALFRYARSGRVARRAARLVATILIVFGPAWTLIVGTALFAQHARLRSALRDGTYTLVEGTVYDRPRGGSDESGRSWLVESGTTAHWYRFDDSPLASGYRRSGPGAGGIRNGARVRIADASGRIARLEVARPAHDARARRSAH